MAAIAHTPNRFGFSPQIDGVAHAQRDYRSTGHPLGEARPGVLLELAGVGVELADAFASFSVAIASSLCIQRNVFSSRWIFVDVGRLGRLRTSAGASRCPRFLHLLQQVGADRQQVAAGQLDDLVHLAEAGAHDLGLVAELLEVVVNPRDRRDARVLVGGDVRHAAVLLVQS